MREQGVDADASRATQLRMEVAPRARPPASTGAVADPQCSTDNSGGTYEPAED